MKTFLNVSQIGFYGDYALTYVKNGETVFREIHDDEDLAIESAKSWQEDFSESGEKVKILTKW